MFRRVVFLALVVAVSLTACSTVPITGRSRFNVVPVGTQMSLGASAYEETLKEATLVEGGADYEMVQRIGARVAEAAKRLPETAAIAQQFDWNVVLINEDVANAWALPGGKSAVYTGLLPITGDEDSLAVVMGHEVAHALASHGAERMSQGIAINVLMGIASQPMSEMSPAQRDLIMNGLGIGIMLPFSRAHESEADEIGLYLSAAAGYDPRASIGLWERMAAMGGAKPPELLSTHPSEATRIENLKRIMPKALSYYAKSGAGN